MSSLTGPIRRTVIAVDCLLVVLFAVVGRASHSEAMTFAGIARTTWPFLVGVVVGDLVAAWRKLPPLSLTAGAIAWAGALVLGMLLRAVSGQGTALAFIVVAAVVLAVLLIGARLLFRTFVRRKITG
jgi:peptidoglycan/LPS O-acetylase OafA/YrhL